MRYLRYEWNNKTYFGVLEDDTVYELSGDYISGAEKTGITHPVSEVKLRAPYIPGKIIGVGANYKSFLDWKKREYPVRPRIFQKPKTAVINPGDTICLPDPDHEIHYEGELAVVIGKICSHVKAADAMDYIFGYTCINDVTDETMFKEDVIWARGKGCDTFAPIGPVVVTDTIDPENAMLETKLNGETVQHMNTSDMHFHIPALIEFISTYMTMEPGDIIATGSPAGVGCIHPGDMVEITIDGIGTLTNLVK